ncbi:MAG: glycosyltransferase family 4 protein [Bacteroidales bacterium]|nr:glycosyltransferase family 4 protein [Bacteroidales bacterium]
MKVLMFGWEFPPHITGGLGTACYGLTRGLVKNDVDVIFVVPKAYGDEDQSYVRLVNASDVQIDLENSEYADFWKRVEYMEVGSNIIPYVSAEVFEHLATMDELEQHKYTQSVLGQRYEFSGKYGDNLLEEVSRYALIASAVAASRDFDVIHAHDWLTYAAGIAAKRVSGKPLVCHIHATEFDRTGDNVDTRIFEIEKSGMMEADLVIAVSNFTRNVCIDRYGIPADKIITVHNAIDPVNKDVVDYHRHIQEKVVTFLGRITYQKGPEYFVEAAYKVLQRDPDVRFVMAGTGDMMKKIIRRVARLKMGNRFHFTGFLKGNEIDRLFALSDVFVMPSVSEPFGLVPLEAMRSNVPVVISKQSGVAEVLKHAIKVDFWDVNAMADSIYGLLNYEALSSTFIKYGKEEVDSLKWENAARKVSAVYRMAIKQKSE